MLRKGISLPFFIYKKIRSVLYMSNIVDLSLLVKEPIVLKFSDQEKFEIPSDPPVELVAKILDFEEKARKAKTNKEQYNLLLDLVELILKQDESKEVTEELISKLSQSQLQAIVKIYQQKIVENSTNPN
jgi:hypothetical protein